MKNKSKILSGVLPAVFLCFNVSANAAEIDMNAGQFQAMDKITGRVSIIEIPVGGAVSFGTFSVLLRSCKTRTEEEVPENFAFVDVSDKSFNKEEYNIFRGWMFSSSPAVNAVEHPIYDVWLLKCLNKEVKKEMLLSDAELTARDNLPRLNEVVATNNELAQNTLISDGPHNILFKDEMYKEEIEPDVINPLPPKINGEPQNLLNIDESYLSEDESVSLSPEDFAKALADETAKFEPKDIETLENQAILSIDDSLEEEIDAELKSRADY